MKNLLLTLVTTALIACQPIPNNHSVNNQHSTQHAEKTTTNLNVDLSVQGYTSTLKSMDVKFLGKTIPYTYSEGKIGNSRGYDWWVSKHFALKSDLPKEKVILYLELLEMAYPHYVALFGMAPPNIERQRIAVVYGSSRARVREAMLDDGFLRGVHKHAGGETMFYNRAGYNFPSHREHHQRYIVIHETMHAFHMALNGHSTWAPNWITEGLADSVAHHVYDPEQKQLTVMVFDRAPMNYIETGLKQYYSANEPTIEQINDDPALKRGLNFFIIHYLLSSPERAQYFGYFVEQLRLANPHSEATLSTANTLLKKTFKDWQKIEQGFADFVQSIKPSFHIVNGPWEQNGNAYWLRNTDAKELSRLDINPAMQATHPVMDFPAPVKNKLIKVNDKQHVSVLLNFEPAQLNRGEIGFALQGQRSEQNQQFRTSFIGKEEASDDQLLKFIVKDAQRLMISANHVKGLKPQSIALSPAIKAALAQNHTLGLNLSLTDTHIAMTLNAELNNNVIEQHFTLPLNSTQLEKLDAQKISLLSKNNNHTVTPYLYTHQAHNTQLTANASLTNPWLFKGDDLLERVFKTCQQHSTQLTQCDEELSQLMAKIPKADLHTEVQNTLTKVAKDYQNTLNHDGFNTLSGVRSTIEYHHAKPFLNVENPSEFDVKLSANVELKSRSGRVTDIAMLEQTLAPGVHTIALPHDENAHTVTVNQTLYWQSLVAKATLQNTVKPFNGVELSVSHQKNDNGHWLFTTGLTGPYSGKTSGKITLHTNAFNQLSANNTQQHEVVIAPYEQKNYEFEVTPTNQPQLITITALLDVDGEAIRLIETVNFTK
ncbi:hypothetical protein [Pseudoalteromonas sp. H105]|uniref:hypothetical protein n=1 Tax=Pseudoalteromonas sp. H105 TaxID=1348393 RepID=UPI000731F1F0|nr:hypothetical protein [Pseudoalteromonas sp. H105]KTF13072.1 hypothetical protein ATS75_16810 [Pseudoalteromonas sp. H105]